MDLADPGIAMYTVCFNSCLPAGQANCRIAQCSDGHSHQSRRYLLPGSQAGIHLPGCPVGIDLPCQIRQTVCSMSLGGNHHDNRVSLTCQFHCSAGSGKDPGCIRHGSASIFLHKQHTRPSF